MSEYSGKWDIDITLTNRDIMHHRMLLGRAAMAQVLVDPTKSYCQGIISDQQALVTYEPIINHACRYSYRVKQYYLCIEQKI